MKTNRLVWLSGTLATILRLGTGASLADIAVFSNPAGITVPVSGSQGPAALYPSAIDVAGIDGDVTGVTVTLHGLTHTCTPDLDVLLVGPTGQNVLLMSDNGYCGIVVRDLTLTFDDAAANLLPEAGLTSIISGIFRPSDSDPVGDSGDTFPFSGLTGPFGTTLSVFNGISPNGTWRLFVNDDTSADIGTIDRGWSLTFAVVPEPATLMLLGIGLGGLFIASHRRRNSGSS